MRVSAVRKHRVDDHYFASYVHFGQTVTQYCFGIAITSIHDNSFDHVGIATGGNRKKHIAAHHLAAAVMGCFGSCVCNDLRQIEEDALHGWVSIENRGERCSMSTTDIDNRTNAGKVVRVYDGDVVHVRLRRHEIMKYGTQLGVLAEIPVDRHFVQSNKSRIAAAQSVEKRSEGRPQGGRHYEDRCVTQRARGVAAQCRADWRQFKLPRYGLTEYPKAHKYAQDALERWVHDSRWPMRALQSWRVRLQADRRRRERRPRGRIRLRGVP